ncbi:uncharacterized protein C115.02c isoform X3 [Cryptomeria japonica]|uniref:uncharacterized protein C115.02c isoform X3 n=1 Tax=Cryptomeria japonica TaxID=3369 RepID=UPI0027DAA0CB|nr:uncharacterized protein C115.02c isoform X3 [Cryptomeria japonica]
MVIMAAIAMVYSRSRILKYSVPLNSVLNPLRFMAFSTMSTPFVTEQHPPAGPLEIYKSKVREGTLKYDPQQEMVAAGLQDLLGQLHQYEKDMENYCARLREWKTRREQLRRELLIEEAERQQKGGLWKIVANMSDSQIVNFFSRKKKERAEPGTGRMVSYLKREKRLDSLVGSCPVVPPAPKGLYLYGNVGCGKTMLMDMFYNATKGVVRHRYRLHFHAAMLDVHARMHKIWQSQKYEQNLQARFSGWIANLPFEGTVKEWLSVQDKYEQELHLDNILSTAADSLLNIGEDSNMEGASVLCFDEIQAVDVFTVVALSGIISRLLNRGIILVATSNRAPEDLNQDGMQKEIFVKFIRELKRHCQNVLVGFETDYRRILADTNFIKGQFFWPLNSQSHFKFEKCWQDLTSQVGGPIISTTISVMFGRLFEIPESCNGLARFTFDQLCACPVGAADYIAIAQNFHTVFIANIPTMSMKISDKARRFITLVDELYNHHCRLICTATSSIDDLFLGTDEGMLFDLESFQFETEMEGTKLRRDVLSSGDVAPIASTNEERTSIHSLLSGRIKADRNANTSIS